MENILNNPAFLLEENFTNTECEAIQNTVTGTDKQLNKHNLNLCICQLIKDEQQYIEEWIEYHHNLGFNKFYLIEDWNSSSHKEILQKYDYVELHKLLDICNDEELALLNKGVFRQKIVYKIFNRLWKKDNDWMAFIDVDEFIEANSDELLDMLNNHKNKNSVELKWKIMKCDGHISHPNNGNKYSILDTYSSYIDTNTRSNIKQIINCNVCNLNDWKCCPHYMYDSFKQNKIYLKHFLCKSFEEWIYRLKNKGEIKTAKWNRTVDFWFDINKEFRYKKDEIISLYITDDFEIKKNDYKI